MIAVALIVLLVALLLTIAVLAGGGESLTVDLFGSEVTTSGAGLYLTGVVVGAATVLALWLLRIGLKMGWRQRKRIRELQRRAEQADEHAHPAPPTETGPPPSGEAGPAHESTRNDQP